MKACNLATGWLIVVLGVSVGTAFAGHVLWNISGTGNWNDGGNWAGGAVPGSVTADSAEIGQGTIRSCPMSCGGILPNSRASRGPWKCIPGDR